MLCAKPYFGLGILPYGCGQCLGCRVNRSRLWSHRIELESLCHGDSCFFTLTYDWRKLVRRYGDTSVEFESVHSLEPKELQGWLKRFRDRILPQKIRFYAVGEYGTNSDRPHYHGVLFGYAQCLFGRSRYRLGVRNCCIQCDQVRDSWGLGNVELGELNSKTSQYVCKYVTKVNTVNQEAFLNGRKREFSRMSLRPGIGARAMDKVGTVLEGPLFKRCLATLGDVPASLCHGKKNRPLGRYLMSKLRRNLGIADGKKPVEAVKAYAEEVQQLYKENIGVKGNSSKSWPKIMVDMNANKRHNQSVKFKIFANRGSL